MGRQEAAQHRAAGWKQKAHGHPVLICRDSHDNKNYDRLIQVNNKTWASR
jgi:hypothetical protein